jgi:hypothetical protein
MAMTAPMPDLEILTEVLRLTDAVTAEWARCPASPVVVNLSRYTLEPEISKDRELRSYLAALDDDHQARLHALYWIGCDHFAGAEHYSSLYEYALTTDLGKDGAAYLAGRWPFGAYLRRGREKLGLVADRSQTHETDSQHLPDLQEDQNHD